MQQTHGVNNTFRDFTLSDREYEMVGGDGFEPPTYAM
jgi:hypothetical protein